MEFFGFKYAFKIGISQFVDFRLNGGKLDFQVLDQQIGRLAVFVFPSGENFKALIALVIVQRNFLDAVFYLFGQFFLPQKIMLGAFLRLALFGAAVIYKYQSAFFGVPFNRDGIAAFAANGEVAERKIFQSFIFTGLTSSVQYLLDLVKKFL